MRSRGQSQCECKHQMPQKNRFTFKLYSEEKKVFQWSLNQKGPHLPAAERSMEGTHLVAFRKRFVRVFLLWAVT